jgi:hypothetical protein
MCDSLIWHPVFRAAARRAGATLALVLAVRSALLEDSLVAGPGRVPILAEGLAVTEIRIARVLEALELVGAMVGGELVRTAPTITAEMVEAIVKPGTLQKRKRRAVLRAQRQLSTELPTGSAPDSVRQCPVLSPGVSGAMGGHVRALGPGWRRVGKGIQYFGDKAGLPDTPDKRPDMSVPHIYIRETHKQKKLAGRAEPDLAVPTFSEPTEILDPALLDNRGRTRWNWVQALKRLAEREMRAKRMTRAECDELLDALPNDVVLRYANYRSNLPVEPYKKLQELDKLRKGEPPHPQRSLILTIAGGIPDEPPLEPIRFLEGEDGLIPLADAMIA